MEPREAETDATLAVAPAALGLPRSGEIDCLFLDIDGVLNRWSDTPLQTINDELAGRLDRVLAECAPLYLVLSSAWRKYGDLYRFLRTRFVIYDRTPTLSRDGIRGDEIDDWLGRHPHATNYVILDDESEEEFHSHQHERLVRVDGRVGFSHADAERVRALIARGRARK